MSAPVRLVVTATGSGAGKTTVAAGLIGAFRRRGLVVQPFKCGPDYIDPTYHAAAAGRASRNLDAWMLEEAALISTFERASHDADAAVIEGVMGLLDGADWMSDGGSTAHVARLLGAAVVLVVDISGSARSAAIEVAGCQRLAPDLRIAGVILNHAGSQNHAIGCARAIEDLTAVPTLGWLPRDPGLSMPERHLGLVPSAEASNVRLIDALADVAERNFELDRLLERSRCPVRAAHAPPRPENRRATGQEFPVLAVARDEAFCFYYPENLELLAEAGIRLVFFSPIRGESPGPEAAGIYLGGGYPELHAETLSKNTKLWNALRTLASRNAPIYAECGGFMTLTQGLRDAQGQLWPMAGLVPGYVEMNSGLAALGYRRITALRPCLLAEAEVELRAHEFHYSHWSEEPLLASQEAAWRSLGTGPESRVALAGFARGNLLASYMHVHFGQRPGIAARFADRLRAHERRLAKAWAPR